MLAKVQIFKGQKHIRVELRRTAYVIRLDGAGLAKQRGPLDISIIRIGGPRRMHAPQRSPKANKLQLIAAAKDQHQSGECAWGWIGFERSRVRYSSGSVVWRRQRSADPPINHIPIPSPMQTLCLKNKKQTWSGSAHLYFPLFTCPTARSRLPVCLPSGCFDTVHG